MSWIGWSLVALVGWGTWPILNRLALRSLHWPHLLIATWISLTLAIAVLLARGVDPRALISRDGALALGASLASLMAVTSFLLALRSGPAVAVTLLSSLYPALTAVLAVLVLDETPSALQWTGVGLAVLAGVLLTRP